MGQSNLEFGDLRACVSVTELVEANLSLVGRLVRERMMKVPAHVCRDDLTSAGMMALFTSARSYDPSHGIPFPYFAAIRIRGALLDELRDMDWATRSVRSQAREVESAQGSLAAVLKKVPESTTVSEAMSVSPNQLHSLAKDLARANVLRLQTESVSAIAEMGQEGSAGPESLILIRERLGYLHDAISELSERLRFIVVAHYFEQRSMVDIAAELGVSQPRVSQLCADALGQLRDGINSQLDPSMNPGQRQSGRRAASRTAYFTAIANRSTLKRRLAMSNSRGDMTIGCYAPHAKSA